MNAKITVLPIKPAFKITVTLFLYPEKRRPADLAFCISMGHSIYVLYQVERKVKDYSELNWKVVLCALYQ